jgi:hypothetical protein
MHRPVPSYPIYDSNTATTQSPDENVTTLTIPANVYYVVFTAVEGKYYIGQDGTALEGVYLEQGTPGPSNFGIHVEPGTVITVRRNASTTEVFNYTYFYNVI